jgi:hypothetical protein
MNIAEIAAVERETKLKAHAEKALGSSLNALMEGDKCCERAFNRTARAGQLETAEWWMCVKCGCTYYPHLEGNIRQWTCTPYVEIIKR